MLPGVAALPFSFIPHHHPLTIVDVLQIFVLIAAAAVVVRHVM
jgi:hypothetical protein